MTELLNDLLENVLLQIVPRNERARMWLDKLSMHCHSERTGELNPMASRVSYDAMRFELQMVITLQGSDPAQKLLYDQAEHLLKQLEASVTEFRMP
jgi:hypothetical protein